MSANRKTGRDHTVIDIIYDREKSKKCIFRLPNVLRRQNPEAYTPDVVSIGPFHHYPEKRGKEEGKGVEEGKQGIGDADFQLTKRMKTRYLNEILTRMKITLEELTAKVSELSDQKNEGGFEEQARNFYAEPCDHISSKEFIEMMIVDGCFLIQLFRKCDHSKFRASDDPVFDMDCMFHFLCHDILLLENQLPWFVIHILYDLTHDIYPDEDSLSFLVLKAFSKLPSLKQGCSSYSKHLRQSKCCDADYLHILDLVRASIVIPLRTIQERAHKAAGKESMAYPEEHEVDSGNKHKGNNEVVHEAIIDPDLHQIRTATALSNVGIKFKSVERDSIMDIRFGRSRGCFGHAILMIPQLNIDLLSEPLFRNLIAIEQCYYGYSNEITSYAIFMDNLICSEEDMDLLRKEKVIGNWMSDEDGCKFFSNLYKGIRHNSFYYVELCRQLNCVYRLKERLIGENTRRELKYFSNPWKVFYLIVGFFLLQIVPTLLQTVLAIKQSLAVKL